MQHITTAPRSESTTHRTLISSLAAGWRREHPIAPRELQATLKRRLEAHTEKREFEANIYRFTMDLVEVRLRGVHDLECIVIGGNEEHLSENLNSYLAKTTTPGKLGLVMVAESSALRSVQAILPPNRCVLLNPDDLHILLNGPEPLEYLKSRIRSQLPLPLLVPYNISLPTKASMFFGRQAEMKLLQYDEATSFAVAGPGQVGKTSLMLQHLHQLLRRQDPRAQRTYLINFMDYFGSVQDSGLSRWIAMRIASSSRSARVTDKTLLQFLAGQAALVNGPLELLLDEVDLVCESQALEVLGIAARDEICRLVMCGRGALLKMMHAKNAPLASRLSLIRPEPLSFCEVEALFLIPLKDLGFDLTSPSDIVRRVFDISGGLPYLVQSLAKRLVERALKDGKEHITKELLDDVRRSFDEFNQSFTPLDDLSDQETRLVALLLIQHEVRDVTANIVQSLVARENIEISAEKALEICNELVISNILIWKNCGFHQASAGIKMFRRQIGDLKHEIKNTAENLMNP